MRRQKLATRHSTTTALRHHSPTVRLMPWLNADTGEVTDEPPSEYVCPTCEAYGLLERDLRNYRSKVTRLENDAERNLVAKRDGKDWQEIIAYWEQAFPDKRLTSKGIKSARATKFFQRCDAGAMLEDIRFAIDAAKVWRWVVFGKRQKSGSNSDLAIDLEHICSVGNDAQFDRLVELGREMAKDVGW